MLGWYYLPTYTHFTPYRILVFLLLFFLQPMYVWNSAYILIHSVYLALKFVHITKETPNKWVIFLFLLHPTSPAPFIFQWISSFLCCVCDFLLIVFLITWALQLITFHRVSPSIPRMLADFFVSKRESPHVSQHSGESASQPGDKNDTLCAAWKFCSVPTEYRNYPKKNSVG